MLKYVNCNIVICELLAFIENKVDVIVNANLIAICESAFLTDEIKSAKTLLYELIKTSLKKVYIIETKLRHLSGL